MALHFGGGVLIFRNINCRQLRHINARPRLEDVGQGDTQHNRHRGDHFEIDNGFGTDPP
ncbi:Uncharacterised protein [Klebsiella pneumoniae]|nr:Uncharacterised protein [Klebsiella pneumoniae]